MESVTAVTDFFFHALLSLWRSYVAIIFVALGGSMNKRMWIMAGGMACMAMAADNGLVLTGYAVGGAGGVVSMGASADNAVLNYSVGQSYGGPIVLGTAANNSVANLGYWAVLMNEQSSAIQVPMRVAGGQGISVQVEAYAAQVSFDLREAAAGTVRVLSADGRALQVLWNGTVNAGSSEMRFDLSQLPAQAAFIVIDAGSNRKTLQFHSINR